MAGGYEVIEFPDVSERCEAVGIEHPQGLALLPMNLDSADSAGDLLYAIETETVEKLWTQAGVDSVLASSEGALPRYQVLHFADWIGPTIFVGVGLLSGNEAAINVALGVVSNYVTDALKGLAGRANATLDVIVETKHGCKKVHYEGPPEGLADLPAVIREVAGDDREE
jgi:hypothetical protein